MTAGFELAGFELAGFELAEIGRPGQDVDPLHGGDVEPGSGRLLSVAELRDALTIARGRTLTVAAAPYPAAAVDRPEPAEAAQVNSLQRVRRWPRRGTPDPRVRVPASTRTIATEPAPPNSAGPTVPHGDGRDTIAATDGLPLVSLGSAALYVVGVSGGSGETTVAALLPGAVPTEHRWPRVADTVADTTVPARVLLVARTTMASLAAAQGAAAQWAAGRVPGVRLLGLAVVADAPGGELRPVADFIGLLTGGLPHIWRFPWVREWRLLPPDPAELPRPVAAVTRGITALYVPAAASER